VKMCLKIGIGNSSKMLEKTIQLWWWPLTLKWKLEMKQEFMKTFMWSSFYSFYSCMWVCDQEKHTTS